MHRRTSPIAHDTDEGVFTSMAPWIVMKMTLRFGHADTVWKKRLSYCSAKFLECRRAHRMALPSTKRADAARNESLTWLPRIHKHAVMMWYSTVQRREARHGQAPRVCSMWHSRYGMLEDVFILLLRRRIVESVTRTQACRSRQRETAAE